MAILICTISYVIRAITTWIVCNLRRRPPPYEPCWQEEAISGGPEAAVACQAKWLKKLGLDRDSFRAACGAQAQTSPEFADSVLNLELAMAGRGVSKKGKANQREQSAANSLVAAIQAEDQKRALQLSCRAKTKKKEAKARRASVKAAAAADAKWGPSASPAKAAGGAIAEDVDPHALLPPNGSATSPAPPPGKNREAVRRASFTAATADAQWGPGGGGGGGGHDRGDSVISRMVANAEKNKAGDAPPDGGPGPASNPAADLAAAEKIDPDAQFGPGGHRKHSVSNSSLAYSTNHQVRTAGAIAPHSHRQALERFYGTVAPEKLGNIDKSPLLAANPVFSSKTKFWTYFRSSSNAILTCTCPPYFPVLEKFSGRESAMYAQIEEQYGKTMEKPAGFAYTAPTPAPAAAAPPAAAPASNGTGDARGDRKYDKSLSNGGQVNLVSLITGKGSNSDSDGAFPQGTRPRSKTCDATADTHKRGWMEKKGDGKFAHWSKRWCELHPNENALKYFAKCGADFKAQVPLDQITAVNRGKADTYMDVMVPGRHYKFRACDKLTRDSWIASINAARLDAHTQG